MSDKTERPEPYNPNDPSQTLPKKKGLLPPLPERPDIKRGNPTVIDTKEARTMARTSTELTLARMTHIAANQPGLDHMSPEMVAEGIVRTFVGVNVDWIKKLQDQKAIEKTVARIRKDRNNFISSPRKLPEELIKKLSSEDLSEQTVDELLATLAEMYS